ncbi:CPBP family intramembrane glutamic endopeptidase [Actinomycetospora aeridis]|uniref:CPBP family intramembrane glutamic endopeptidase n=1 Tax=Actinomycetospora aeridis TaxID=3129231 RepID=A0ABU8NEL9_9PSEU
MTGVMTAPSAANRTRARRGLAVFLTLAIVFEALCLTALLTTGQAWWIFVLMWSVTLASVIARLVMREGFRDVSFRFGGARSVRWIVVGLLLPLVVGALSFGTAWLVGLVPFAPPEGGFWALLLGTVTVGLVLNLVWAAGEEIGWRGYMLTRFIDAGIPRPVLTHAIVWGLWHLPLILAGLIYTEHPVTIIAALVFMVSVVPYGCILARARLSTGSVWPGIAAHGAYNSIIQGAFWPAAAAGGASAAVWVGMETGILVAVALILVGLALCAGTWTYRRTPDELMAGPREG